MLRHAPLIRVWYAGASVALARRYYYLRYYYDAADVAAYAALAALCC